MGRGMRGGGIWGIFEFDECVTGEAEMFLFIMVLIFG